MPAFGQSIVAPFGDRLCSPLDHLATFQELAEKWVQLRALKHLVHIVRCPLVIKTDDESERDEIPRQRIHEGAAETIIRNGPTEGVHHCVEGLECLPDLFHAQREDLRIVGLDLLPLEIRLRQCAARSFGKYGY